MRNARLLCGSMFAVACLSGEALAQAAQQSSATSDEVVVTALKREGALQDVPAAITALSEDALTLRGVGNIESLANQVPNVIWGEQTSASLITIRGVGTSVDTGIAEPNVGIHIDGVFQSRATMATLELQDVSRIEVLRGPQGTLYGRNSTGGAINIISAKPTENFEAEVGASGGNFGQYGVRGFVSGPLGGGVKGRLSAMYRHSDGFYENIFTGKDDADESDVVGVRGALAFELSDNISADLSVYHQALTQDSYVGQQVLYPIPGFLVGLGGSAAGVATSTYSTEPHKIGSDFAGSNEIRTTGVTGNLAWQLGPNLQLKSITGYIDHTLEQSFDGDATSYGQTTIGVAAGNPNTTPRRGDATMFSQEFNLSGQFGTAVNWLVGGYYFDEQFKPDIPAPLPNGFPAGFAPPTGLPPGTIIVQYATENTKSLAAFVDATFNITDDLRFSAGVRHSHDEKEFVQTSGVSIPSVPIAFTLSCSDLKRERSFNSTTPRVALEYDATEDVLFYGQYAKGFRSGGFNISDCADDYAPEEVSAFEIGLKTAFGGGRGTLNLAAFNYDYTGLQIFQINGFTQNIANADATVKGAEAELTYAPIRSVQLNAAASWLDAKYDDFPNIDPLNPLAGAQQLSGKRLNRAPEYTFSGGAQWTIDADKIGLPAGGELRLRGEVYHSAEVYYRPFNLATDAQDAYTTGNIFADYRTAQDLNFRLYVKNVSDEEIIAQALANPVEATMVGHYAPPRTFGLEISKRF